MKKSRNDVNRKLLQFDTEHPGQRFSIEMVLCATPRWWGISVQIGSYYCAQLIAPHRHIRQRDFDILISLLLVVAIIQPEWSFAERKKNKCCATLLSFQSARLPLCIVVSRRLAAAAAERTRPSRARCSYLGRTTQCATNFAKMFLSVSPIHYMLPLFLSFCVCSFLSVFCCLVSSW